MASGKTDFSSTYVNVQSSFRLSVSQSWPELAILHSRICFEKLTIINWQFEKFATYAVELEQMGDTKITKSFFSFGDHFVAINQRSWLIIRFSKLPQVLSQLKSFHSGSNSVK